jgi:hypothetical protein
MNHIICFFTGGVDKDKEQDKDEDEDEDEHEDENEDRITLSEAEDMLDDECMWMSD